MCFFYKNILQKSIFSENQDHFDYRFIADFVL